MIFRKTATHFSGSCSSSRGEVVWPTIAWNGGLPQFCQRTSLDTAASWTLTRSARSKDSPNGVAVLDGLIAEYRGFIVNTAGDSVLAEFRSAVEAVQCALEAQTALAETNANLPADKRISFRIGIHIGDVMVRGGELFGDGVNMPRGCSPLRSREVYVSRARRTIRSAKSCRSPLRILAIRPSRTFKNQSECMKQRHWARHLLMRRRAPSRSRTSRPSPCCRSRI